MSVCSCVLTAVILAGCGDRDRIGAGGRETGGTAATASALDAVLARGKLIAGVRRDSPPFGFQDADGNLWGFDVDLARAVAGRLKVGLELVPVTASTRLEKLKSGAVDMLAASCTITRAREEEVDFSVPYFADKQAFLVKADSPVAGYLDLAGKTVGAVEGSTAMENVRIVQPDAKVAGFRDYGEAFAALKDGRVDAVASDSIILLGLISGDKAGYRIVGRFGYEPYGIAVRQDDSRWRDRINGILMDMWEEGALQRLYESWFGERGKFPAEIDFSMTTYPKGRR
ncbi:MAG: transporter substrate-binding domain-containing protein [Planctomycetota bacterium]|nr:transporter substrate-binding domain-containing protein [Planctomycetota bacterium]